MFVVGFATAAEITRLEARGFEVQEAPYGLVSPYSSDETATEPHLTSRDRYLLANPEAGTKAVAVFLDAALHDVVLCWVVRKYTEMAANSVLNNLGWIERIFNKPSPNSLNVHEYIARREQLRADANVIRADAEDFNYCSHKNPDGSDARYPTGNGETACICGNKWD
jgi:hypothetical protein